MTDLKDLVARLRAYGDHSATIGDMYRLERDCAAAADAIERLSVKAEPVAWVRGYQTGSSGDHVELHYYTSTTPRLKVGDNVYAHPAGAAPEGPDHPDGPDSEGFHGVRPYAPNLIALVNRQAEDEGLWFVAQTAPEAYLQAALRKLHAAIEGEKI